MAQFPNPQYPKGPRGGFHCVDRLGKAEPSKALQSGKDEADINFIVNRFLRTGVLPAAASRPPVYGDLTVQPNLAQALQMQLAAVDVFNSFPDAVRKSVGSMDKFEAWIKNPDNSQLALKYGLLKLRKPLEPPAAPPAAPPKEPPQAPPAVK